MTIDEAVEILNKGYTPRGDREAFKQYFLAREKAIRSLCAWKLAKAEILKAQTYVMFEGDTELYIERKDVLKIIDEHLKEVENDTDK